MFSSRSHHVDKPGHYRLLFMIIAHKCFINGTTLVHVIDKLVGKYIMEQCDIRIYLVADVCIVKNYRCQFYHDIHALEVCTGKQCSSVTITRSIESTNHNVVNVMEHYVRDSTYNTNMICSSCGTLLFSVLIFSGKDTWYMYC